MADKQKILYDKVAAKNGKKCLDVEGKLYLFLKWAASLSFKWDSKNKDAKENFGTVWCNHLSLC